MTPRRIVIAVSLLAFAAGTGSALADQETKKPRNEICVVFAQDDNGDVTKDICINWPGPHQ